MCAFASRIASAALKSNLTDYDKPVSAPLVSKYSERPERPAPIPLKRDELLTCECEATETFASPNLNRTQQPLCSSCSLNILNPLDIQ